MQALADVIALRRPNWNGIAAAAAIAACLLAVPVIVVLGSVFMPSRETWAHLSATVLPEYIANTLWLTLGATGGTGGSATGDTGTSADDGRRGCPNKPDVLCVPWTREVQGECPATVGNQRCGTGCIPVGLGPGVYEEGQCCWTVEAWWPEEPCGCRC